MLVSSLFSAESVTTPVATPAQLAAARTILDSQLRDYEGSKFRDFRAVTSTSKKGKLTFALCGEMNARNAMGGLTGWRKTAIVLEGGIYSPTIFSVGADGLENLVEFASTCPLVGPTGTVMPQGVAVGVEDVTAALEPSKP